MTGWAATNTLRKCISNPVVPNIYDADARAALALVEIALDAAERAEAKLRREYVRGLDDEYATGAGESWAEGEALAAALRAVREGA